MKKLFMATFSFVCAALICLSTSCGSKGKVESVNGHNTIYRYKVESVQLVDEFNSDKVFETTNEFKYISSENEYELYYTLSGSNVEDYTYHFPNLTFNQTYNNFYSSIYCDEYSSNVRIIIKLGKIDKEYRPKCSVSNNVATIKHFEFTGATSGSSNRAYKKQISYSKYEKLIKQFKQEDYDNRKDSDKLKEIQDNRSKTYSSYAVIYEAKEKISISNNSLQIEYHP